MRRVFALILLAIVTVNAQPSDDLDAFIRTQMARRQIVGLSLAIIEDGRVAETRAYGTTTRGGKTPVTATTLFQAGSISKAVSALGALRLVEAGRLSLDDDVNSKLKSWRVPDNEFTRTERVTLRRLLSHSAGLSVPGFPGYAVTERVPSLPEILDGKGNTAAVRVEVTPGSTNRYSGGGYTVVQQLVEDVSGRPFADYMRDEVLKPLGMTDSTFQQPLPTELTVRAATGYRVDRSEMPGRWHVYPEMAAAGLWTTPADLAKYAIGVQQAFAGKSGILSADMTRQMLTRQPNAGSGLGPSLDGVSPNKRFSHNGRDRGFDALLTAYAEAGKGLVVMINGNDNTRLMQGGRIVDFVARKYRWPAYDWEVPEAVTTADVTPAVASALTGRYEYQNNNMLVLAADNGRVFTYADGLPDQEFVMTAEGRFVSTEAATSFKLLRNTSGEVDGIEWTFPNKTTRRAPRIGPLFSAIHPGADPDPAFTRNVLTVVRALAAGGKATGESPLLTAGARKTFTAPAEILTGVRAVAFMHEYVVVGKGIERHGHAIQRVLHYRLDTERGERWLLVHVDANGLVADYDVVAN